MSDKTHKRIESAANISIMVAALIGSLILVKNYLWRTGPVSTAVASLARAAPPGPRAPAIGTPVSLPGVDWAKNGNTLVMVLSKACHFCTESAPFYRQVLSQAAKRTDLHVVAALPQEVSEAKEYLAQIDVPVREVIQAPLSALGTRGTPTLLLVDRKGTVQDTWLGRLDSGKEAEVLQKLGCESGCQ